MRPSEKTQAETMFRDNQRKIMICTKAFGMGVDIPDIQVIYHHAPAGLVPDYIQEIGRVARDPDTRGFATIDYSSDDQRYSKQLHGMSSLRMWQLKAVLKKLYNTYRNKGERRNMLVSAEDFSFIFGDDSDQKVKKALMMIEKDYLLKYGFNVVLARPKQLFTKSYITIADENLTAFQQEYGTCFSNIGYHDNRLILFLDMQKMWRDFFSEKSFPAFKYDFSQGNLFNYDVRPLKRMEFLLNAQRDVVAEINRVYQNFSDFLRRNRRFKKEQLKKFLEFQYDNDKAEKLSAFLTTFNDILREQGDYLHVIPGRNYDGVFQLTINLLNRFMRENTDEIVRYRDAESRESYVRYVRLGQLIEILDLGSFEIRSGADPMIFVRLNSPERVREDSTSGSYQNLLFEKTQERHKINTEIMDFFFTHVFTNDDRWAFIEDFFLGMDNQELMSKYPGAVGDDGGTQHNNTDIVAQLTALRQKES